ncbi:hypothetical protein P3T76_015670 [Phytophthora citrophthora]|uniref:BAT2 N-terminal domain-containing protein n=1 Tax=Phytophthora citrophthora TaxID=4793 RepID=A0AAD9LA27_9STRA|nr:hypothetical protein P3T76_015670 [Phytophthora citrophthora]
MNPIASAKPKAKFSSRNLNAAFKAPLRTKPLPDHATGPLQRPNNRLLVLGRAAVAAPAPLNTLSLKRESQVDDVHVSLVPAGSNWAEKQQNQQEEETSEHSPAPATDVVASTVTSDKAWTPESVAEHLHTGSAPPVRLETKVESSGRWGDDAVENDIVQSNIRRQMQKEREFPDLKEVAEETHMHHGQGHNSTADSSPSMGPQQSEQHHGRATGRWAQFAEPREMHRSIPNDRWSQDRCGRDEDDRWPRDRYERGEDNYWARGRYNHDEDDRWSRGRYSRYDDGYGRERRSYETSSNTVSPIPNDSHTHFSSSDARFDMVVSGDRDRVLSHSPHRMNWGSPQFGRRDERSSSPASQEGSRFQGHHADLTLNQPSSTSPAPMMAADAKTMNWRKLSNTDHGLDRGLEAPRQSANEWSKDEEPITPVAEAAESSTESSNSSTTSSPNQHQIQLLKRPKMLFDPKTGGMVKAEEKTKSDPPTRQTGNRHGDKDRDSTPATKRNSGKPKAVYKVATAKATKTEGAEEAPAISASVQKTAVKDAECSSEIVCSNPVLVEPNTDDAAKEDRAPKRLPRKQARGNPEENGHHGTTLPRDPKAGASRSTQQSKQQYRDSQASAGNGRGGSRPNERSKRSSSTRNNRRDVGTSKPAQRRYSRKVELTGAHTPAVVSSDTAVLRQIADGSNGDVVVVTDQQEAIEVNPEGEGFETVKSRRTVLSEKKKLRQRLASSETVASKVEEKKPASVFVAKNIDEQSKGEQAQETFRPASTVQPGSKLLGKAANARSNGGQTLKDKKSRGKQQKYLARTSGTKKPTTNSDKPVFSEVKQPGSPPKPMEQVPGEAPTETAVVKKRVQYVKVSPRTEAKQEQKSRREKSAQRNSSSGPSEQKSTAGSTRKQESEGKRVVEKVFTTKARAPPAAKLRPKQARQVYVVKTPAPVSSTSTAA